MQSIKDIKKRIRSVSETAQITKAMELISAAKMRKALDKYRTSLANLEVFRSTFYSIVSKMEFDEPHPFLTERKGKRAFLVIGADKGMNGDYNHAVAAFTLENTTEEDVLFCVGANLLDMLPGRNVVPVRCSPEGTMEDARLLSNVVMKNFETEYTELHVLYTTMKNRAVQECRSTRLLPVCPKPEELPEQSSEPEEMDVNGLCWQFVIGSIYHCIAAARYTEHMERRRAMNAATENANELLGELQINYNKARQEKITTELTELSGGLIEN